MCMTDTMQAFSPNGICHREGRVLSFFSSRRNWDSPTPLAAGECASHSLVRGEGEGLGESKFRRGDIHCGALCIKVLCGIFCRVRWMYTTWISAYGDRGEDGGVVVSRVMRAVLGIRKYFFRIRGSVILIYGSGSWRPVNYGSGSYLDIFVGLWNCGSGSRRSINYESTEYGIGYTPLGEWNFIADFSQQYFLAAKSVCLYNVVDLLIFKRCRESNQEHGLSTFCLPGFGYESKAVFQISGFQSGSAGLSMW